MPQIIRFTGSSLMERLKKRWHEEWFIFKLTFWSLFYNSFTSWSVAMDTALEPMFWFVDHFVKYLGPAFVLAVVCLTTSVVIIFYTCLVPHHWAHSPVITVFHLTIGHWCLMNIIFHYFMAAFTAPGSPPEEIPEIVSICKKCISPKPPRTHHCSICNRCILKMDHHCPWLNNCVGHYNQRYFFMFCFYMWFGTVYVSINAYPVFKDHFFGNAELGIAGAYYQLHVTKEALAASNYGKDPPSEDEDLLKQAKEGKLYIPSPTRDTSGMYFHHFIIYEFMLCSGVAVALGLLTVWHARLITRGETSIEVHTNKKERARLKKKGMVQYSHGASRTLGPWAFCFIYGLSARLACKKYLTARKDILETFFTAIHS